MKKRLHAVVECHSYVFVPVTCNAVAGLIGDGRQAKKTGNRGSTNALCRRMPISNHHQLRHPVQVFQVQQNVTDAQYHCSIQPSFAPDRRRDGMGMTTSLVASVARAQGCA